MFYIFRDFKTENKQEFEKYIYEHQKLLNKNDKEYYKHIVKPAWPFFEENNNYIESRDYFKAKLKNTRSIYEVYHDNSKFRDTDYTVKEAFLLDAARGMLNFTFRLFRQGCAAVSSFSPAKCKIALEFCKKGKVVDPFAGWGQRAKWFSEHGWDYIGFDLNIYKEHQGYNVKQQDIFKANTDKTHYDVLLTCPPYGDREIYDNLDTSKKEEDYVNQAMKIYPNVDTYIFFVSKDFPVKENQWSEVRYRRTSQNGRNRLNGFGKITDIVLIKKKE